MNVVIDLGSRAHLRYFCGYLGENNATTLEIIPPRAMTERSDINNYRLIFSNADWEQPILSSPYAPADDITYTIGTNLTAKDRVNLELWGEDGEGNLLCKSQTVYLLFAQATLNAIGDIPEDNPQGILAEIGANTLARHIHTNKPQLDKIGENGSGALTYNNTELASRESVDSVVTDLAEFKENVFTKEEIDQFADLVYQMNEEEAAARAAGDEELNSAIEAEAAERTRQDSLIVTRVEAAEAAATAEAEARAAADGALDGRITANSVSISDQGARLAEAEEAIEDTVGNTRNLFKMEWLENSLITLENGVIIGKMVDLYNSFRDDKGGIPIEYTFKQNVPYTISLKAKATNIGSASAATFGLTIRVVYDDNQQTLVRFNNVESDYLLKYAVTSNARKIDRITITYGSAPNAIWSIKEFQIVEGATLTPYIKPVTAIDRTARSTPFNYGTDTGSNITIDSVEPQAVENYSFSVLGYQEGEGEPSIENPREIIPVNTAGITVTVGNQIKSYSYNLAETFGYDFFGGTYNNLTGTLSIETRRLYLHEIPWAKNSITTATTIWTATLPSYHAGANNKIAACNCMPVYNSTTNMPVYSVALPHNNIGRVFVRTLNSEIETNEDLLTWLEENNAYIVYSRRDATDYSMSVKTIELEAGENTIKIDSGELTITAKVKPIDTTLTKSGRAADAKAVGDIIEGLVARIEALEEAAGIEPSAALNLAPLTTNLGAISFGNTFDTTVEPQPIEETQAEEVIELERI